MGVVVDASLVAAIILPLPYSDQVARSIAIWQRAGQALLAPLLLEYEVAAVLRDIHCLPPTVRLHEQALRWAQRLGHSKTYDAHYLAVAEQEQVDLWTADRRLVNGARQAGVPWVHWIGDLAAGQP